MEGIHFEGLAHRANIVTGLVLVDIKLALSPLYEFELAGPYKSVKDFLRMTMYDGMISR